MMTEIAQALTDKWWTFLLRGFFALALAIFAFAEPSAMQSGLVYLVAAYFILSGIMAIYGGVSFTGVGQWWLLILVGLASVALGIMMISQPGLGPLALAYMVAIYAISTGLLEVAAGIEFRQIISNEGWWIFFGIVTVALGVYIAMRPDIGIVALVYAVGIYAALAAGSLFALAFRLKSAGNELAKGGRVSPAT